MLVLLFTFSRSECPCPQTLDGFDPKTHWRFSDLKLARVADVVCLWVRFKAIKQDRRMERPAAQPTPDEPGESGDWAYVGDIPDSIFSVQLWATRLLAFGVARRPGDPFFLHRDRCRPLTYGAALDFLRVMQRRLGRAPEVRSCRAKRPRPTRVATLQRKALRTATTRKGLAAKVFACVPLAERARSSTSWRGAWHGV